MQIQVNTDRNIEGTDELAAQVNSAVENALSRYSDQVTQVEVHLSDENSNKKGGNDDIRCLIQAHLAGSLPTAVSHQAATVDEAVEGAAGKLARSFESTIGRSRRQESRRNDSHLPDSELTEQS